MDLTNRNVIWLQKMSCQLKQWIIKIFHEGTPLWSVAKDDVCTAVRKMCASSNKMGTLLKENTSKKGRIQNLRQVL